MTDGCLICTVYLGSHAMVVHLAAVLVPAIVVCTALLDYSFFSWHPICLSIAYAFLMPQGILLFSPYSSLFPNASRWSKVTYHTYVLLAMLGIIYAGQSVIYLVKESKGKAHLTSWHGLLGVITVAYTSAQVLAGVFVKYASMFKLPKSITLADLKLYHGASGCALFLLSCVTLALGLSSTWFVSQTNQYVRGACLVAVLFSAIAVANHANGSIGARLRR